MLKNKVSKTDAGINIKFFGNVEKEKIQNMVEDCASGECSCNCDPLLMEKVEDMCVNEDNGEVSISLKGKSIKIEEIENAIKECSIG